MTIERYREHERKVQEILNSDAHTLLDLKRAMVSFEKETELQLADELIFEFEGEGLNTSLDA